MNSSEKCQLWAYICRLEGAVATEKQIFNTIREPMIETWQRNSSKIASKRKIDTIHD